MELTADQAQSLVGGGECPLHFHAFDGPPYVSTMESILATLAALTAPPVVLTVTAGTTALTGAEDYVIADTSSGNVLLEFPVASITHDIEVLKPYGQGYVQITADGTDTILLQTQPVIFRTRGAALRFRAFGTDWKII